MQQPQLIQPFVPGIAFHRDRDTAPAYWMLDLLWLVLADGRDAGGGYSVMEQLMPQGSGPPIPHIHPIDEWFYVIEGELTLKLGEQTIAGGAGNFVWIPRGTVHLFTVTSQLCRALNCYTPAGFEQVIIGLADPAERRELPPPMGKPDQVTIDKVFNNYWCAEAKDDWSLSRMGVRRSRARGDRVGSEKRISVETVIGSKERSSPPPVERRRVDLSRTIAICR